MKNKIISVAFSAFLLFILILNIITTPKKVSYSERRELAKFPQLTLESLFDGQFAKKFDKYSLDHFPFRQGFRKIKALVDLKIFRKLDNNKIYVEEGHISKMEYPLDLDNVYMMADKLNGIYELYLRDMEVYYSIIPNKNYFIAESKGYPHMNYDDLVKTMINNIKNMTYINIMDSLELEDFYRTDIHWRQEKLGEVVKALGREMGFVKDFDRISYKEHSYYPFYGGYYGQALSNIRPDSLIYLISPAIDKVKVFNYQDDSNQGQSLGMYGLDKLEGVDPYDIFLYGASPLIVIENLENKSGRELIISRDSFASSLAPLLIEEYRKISLIDLRYVSHKTIGDLVEFENQEILFLYSTAFINRSGLLR